MIGLLKKIYGWIDTGYRFLWKSILCREEPFTYQLTRMAVRHGIFFWAVFYIISGWCFYNIFEVIGFRSPLHILLGVVVLIFLAWLTDHLNDQVHDKPGEY